jgi:hypothetical protein
MGTVFWDRKEVLIVEVMQRGTTLHSEVYCETLKETSYGNSEHQACSAHRHTAARTKAQLEHFNWELFDHPPYSLDLGTSDCHLFTYLKNSLRSQVFKNNE